MPRTAVLPTATVSPGHPIEDAQFPDAPDEEAGAEEHGDIDPPVIFGTEELHHAAQLISDIHGKLALAYAMALTFQRAVRGFIPIDDLDILPCLSFGVLDVLDTQLPRLDALLDHLTRCAAHVPAARAFPQSPARYSRRARVADDPQPVFGIVHGTPPDPGLDPSAAEMPRRSL
jgi:hypothetical protein